MKLFGKKEIFHVKDPIVSNDSNTDTLSNINGPISAEVNYGDIITVNGAVNCILNKGSIESFFGKISVVDNRGKIITCGEIEFSRTFGGILIDYKTEIQAKNIATKLENNILYVSIDKSEYFPVIDLESSYIQHKAADNKFSFAINGTVNETNKVKRLFGESNFSFHLPAVKQEFSFVKKGEYSFLKSTYKE